MFANGVRGYARRSQSTDPAYGWPVGSLRRLPVLEPPRVRLPGLSRNFESGVPSPFVQVDGFVPRRHQPADGVPSIIQGLVFPFEHSDRGVGAKGGGGALAAADEGHGPTGQFARFLHRADEFQVVNKR